MVANYSDFPWKSFPLPILGTQVLDPGWDSDLLLRPVPLCDTMCTYEPVCQRSGERLAVGP